MGPMREPPTHGSRGHSTSANQWHQQHVPPCTLPPALPSAGNARAGVTPMRASRDERQAFLWLSPQYSTHAAGSTRRLSRSCPSRQVRAVRLVVLMSIANCARGRARASQAARSLWQVYLRCEHPPAQARCGPQAGSVGHGATECMGCGWRVQIRVPFRLVLTRSRILGEKSTG
jgi:hypothetical protein